MKRALAFLLLTPLPLSAQIPRAERVEEDPAPQRDVGNESFLRGVRIHDSANRSSEFGTRKALYEQAAGIFARFLADFSNHPHAEKAWWYLGNSYYHSGQIEDAKRCFHTLLNRHGKGEWAGLAAYTLGADHANKGEFAFAAPMFERFAANTSKREEAARGYYLAAECYRRLGRDREATINYRKVVEDPAGALYAAQAKIALGHLAVKSGKLQEALDQFEEVVAGPHTAKARGEAALQAALAATKLKQPEIADQHLRQIMTTDGMEDFRPQAQTALMANHFENEQYREVIQLYRRSSLKAVGDAEAERLMLAAQSHYRLGDPRAASSLFREVEAMVSPDSELAYRASYYRLLCSYETGADHTVDQVDGFLQIYRRSRPHDPHIHLALLIKAETLFADRQVAEAAKVYSEIDATALSESNRPGLLFQRGWCLAEAGDTQGAIRSFSEFLAKYPEDERRFRALARRAKAYAEIGDPAKANADFDRLLGPSVPEDLAAFAWLESARLRRSESNIQDTVVRYKGLLQNVSNLSETLEGEANYWIGWGLVKSDEATEAVAHLEKARELRPETYSKHAGLLLALGYYAAQDAQRLTGEIELAIQAGYADDIPDQAVQWAAMQAYSAGNYPASARFLQRVANPEEPRETSKGVWRFLAKAKLRTGDYEEALTASINVLAVEDNPGWKADGLHDKGRALLGLGRPADASEAVNDALALRPPPRTMAQLRLLSGDLMMADDEAQNAAAEFLAVATSTDDEELKPLALWKLERALIAMGDTSDAEKHRAQRQEEFPSWSPPEI